MSEESPYWIEGTVPETPTPAEYPQPWGKTSVVGTRLPRVDAYERVSGTAVYPSDVILPGMLYGAILRCPHARARILSVDSASAEAMSGVHAVITASTPEADIPWAYRRGPESRLFPALCQHEGEAVAAVAAETPQQATDALRAIKVNYEVLPHVTDQESSSDPESPKIWDDGNELPARPPYERGDVGQGFAAADVVLERIFTTACEIHVPMETHGCVAQWDGDRLTLWESTQGVFAVQARVAEILGLPLSKVRIVGHYMGGGFGSKLQAGKYSIIAPILARLTARPVKLFLSREENMLCVGNRPPSRMTLKAGVKKDGTLTALAMETLSTPGAYAAGGFGLEDWQVRDLYTVANVRTSSRFVFINAGPARPFRAPGHPQGSWALEQMMDDLAEAIGMDPIVFRRKNIPSVSQARGGQPYTTTGLDECLTEGAAAFSWEAGRSRTAQKTHLKRGVGMGACLWIAGGGGPPSTAIVKIFADGSVNLNLGASDIGTGTKSVMAMIVAEELGVDPHAIQIEHADTATTQFATPSGGSKTVPTESPAVREAAYAVRRRLIELAAEQHELNVEDLNLATGAVVSKSDPAAAFPISELEGLQRRGLVMGVGYRGPNPAEVAITPFAAQFCEVEVNTRTGEIRILRFLGAHDSGRGMNRLTYDNQVFGGITMGIGLALTEERILDQNTGKMVNANFHDYKIPTALDVPTEMTSLAIDPQDEQCNTTGAKGIGEPVTIPTAGAIANAVFHATGVRITQSPITPARFLEAQAAQAKEV